MTTTAVPAPPADAVARDAHWRAKIARAKARAPMRRTVTLEDDAAHEALGRARLEAQAARERIRPAMIENVRALGLSDRDAVLALEEAIGKHPTVVAAMAAVEAAEADVDEADVAFTFQGIDSTEWEEIVGSCPPTDEQAARGETYDINRFAPAVVARCSVYPESDPNDPVQNLTVMDAAELVGGEVEDEEYPGRWIKVKGSLTQGEASMLVTMAVTVNTGARAAVGKG